MSNKKLLVVEKKSLDLSKFAIFTTKFASLQKKSNIFKGILQEKKISASLFFHKGHHFGEISGFMTVNGKKFPNVRTKLDFYKKVPF